MVLASHSPESCLIESVKSTEMLAEPHMGLQKPLVLLDLRLEQRRDRDDFQALWLELWPN